ncbi:MAG: sigma-70 family RNA polymerase sigma factor [Xanthomonadales bacterium]|nr:sigma-70 family RNA polymerase sigma factor [Xanthomonadales bacterium]
MQDLTPSDPNEIQQIGEDVNPGLVRRIRHGDRAAEAELVRRYGRGLKLVLERRIKDPELVQDVFQETFQTVLLRLRQESIEQPDRLSAFIHRTALYLAVSHFRKESRRLPTADVVQLDQILDDSANPYLQLAREQLRCAVMQLLDELDVPRDRELLMRHYLQDQDKATLCADFLLSSDQFDKVLSRARHRLKQLLLQYLPMHQRHDDGES